MLQGPEMKEEPYYLGYLHTFIYTQFVVNRAWKSETMLFNASLHNTAKKIQGNVVKYCSSWAHCGQQRAQRFRQHAECCLWCGNKASLTRFGCCSHSLRESTGTLFGAIFIAGVGYLGNQALLGWARCVIVQPNKAYLLGNPGELFCVTITQNWLGSILFILS